MPIAFDVDERLIHPPRGTYGTGEAVPTLFELGDVALNPTADRARGHLDATLEHHLCEIAVGQLVGNVPADAQQNGFVGKVALPEERMALSTSHRGVRELAMPSYTTSFAT